MPRPTRATPAERAAYASQTPAPLYPLSHWVTVNGHRCAVEYLGDHWDKGDPQYEVMLPEGMHCEYELLHTLLCADLNDVRDRTDLTKLVPCSPTC